RRRAGVARGDRVDRCRRARSPGRARAGARAAIRLGSDGGRDDRRLPDCRRRDPLMSGTIPLLRSLLAAITGRPQAQPAGADEVVALARNHRLSPLLSLADLSGWAAPLAETLRRDRVLTIARNLQLAQAAEECAEALTAAGVPVVLLKGLSYNLTIYEEAGARPTADIDLLVPDAARRTAFETLDRLGFEPRAAAPGFDEADYHEVAWARGGVDVDLH